MITILLIIALLIQFAGVYALIIHAQRAQDAGGRAAKPDNQRSRQAYYDAFAKSKRPDKGRRGDMAA